MVQDIFVAFRIAAETIADPINFLLIILGTLFGLLLGLLPGLGGSIALALLIPVTFGMEPLVAFMLFAAAKGGTNFGGSITAILINTPGMAPNAATLIDGYPMTRQGRSGEALGASAMASAAGAIFGIIILAISIPILLQILFAFGPPEIFWLGVWGLTVIPMVIGDSVKSGLISAGFGLLFAFHGLNQFTATYRWSYGVTSLESGVPLIPSLIGLFAIAEMVRLVSDGQQIENKDVEVTGNQWDGVRAVFIHKRVFFQSAIIGTIIGMVPGVGGTAANYIAYFQAVQTSSDPDSFGSGDIRGVIASEASNDAKDGGGYLPTLGFGIPGSASMAVLLGAFLLHGITPGPLLFQEHLDIVAVIILAAVLSNLLTSSIGLILAEQLSRVTRVDIRILAPIIVAISLVGSFGINNNPFDIFIAIFFGLFGYLMIRANMSRVPMVLGMVLGPIVEGELNRTLQIAQGDYSIFVRKPLTVFLVLLVLTSLFLPYIEAAITQIIKRSRRWF